MDAFYMILIIEDKQVEIESNHKSEILKHVLKLIQNTDDADHFITAFYGKGESSKVLATMPFMHRNDFRVLYRVYKNLDQHLIDQQKLWIRFDLI